MIHIACQCGRVLKVPAARAGKSGDCPQCQHSISLIAPHLADDREESAACLVCTAGPQHVGRQYFLAGDGPIMVGKHVERDLPLVDPKVSRRHCRLVRGQQGWRVEDQGSTNGTEVNGQKVDACDLHHGDELLIGDCAFTYLTPLDPSRPEPSEANKGTTVQPPAPPPKVVQVKPRAVAVPAPPQPRDVEVDPGEDTQVIAAPPPPKVVQVKPRAAAEPTPPPRPPVVEVKARAAARPGQPTAAGMPRRKESAAFDDDGLLALTDGEMDEGPPRPVTPVGRQPKPMQPVAGGPTCPSCKRVLLLGAVICVDCGLNLKTGRSILTSLESGLDETYAKAESVTRWISWLIPWGLYPVASEAFGTCKPYAIRAIAAVTVLVSMYFLVLFYTGSASFDSWQDLMLWSGRFDRSRIPAELVPPGMTLDQIKPGDFGLGTYHPYQLVTHALLHADPFHLAGNMLFLLVFGSRVNALIGNILSVLAYPLLAVFAALFQMAAGANAFFHPMLGASGAVMGLAGMYLVLFPLHKVHVLTWYRFGLLVGFRLSFKIFAIRGFWVVLFYIGLDVLYTILGAEDNVARWAHLGGFFTGAVLAMGLMMTRLVNARGGDLLTTLFGRYAWGIVGRPGRGAAPEAQAGPPLAAQSSKPNLRI